MAKYILGSKHHTSNDNFQDVWNNIENYVSRQEAEQLVLQAASVVKSLADGKKAAYAWSGGKDSLALQVVMERAGIYRGMCAVVPALSYPSFLEWLDTHIPYGVERYDLPYDLQWLADNEEKFLFPYSAQNNYPNAVHIKAQNQYNKENKIDIMFYGRRIQDQNFCGRRDKNFCYKTTKSNTYRCCPIAEWKHEDVLAVIHYFLGDVLPTTYMMDGGFSDASFIWSNRYGRVSREQAWKSIYNDCPQIVKKAAQYIPSAAQFISSITNCITI